MSKLAIVLCTVLFASVVNASPWADALKNSQFMATETIDDTISRVSLQLDNTKAEINKKIQATLEKSTTFCNKISMDMMEIGKNVSIEIEHVAKDIDVSNCIKLSNDLYRIAKAVVSKISVCVDNKLKIKLKQIEDINSITKNVLPKLNKFKADVKICGDNVVIKKRESVEAAIACANAAAEQATSLSINAIAKLDSVEIDKMLRLDTILIDCPETCGYGSLYLQAKKTSNCVGKAIRLAEETASTNL